MSLRRYSFHAMLLAAALAAGPDGARADPRIEPGAWGVTIQGDAADRMGGQLKMMEQELAKLPPAQQEQMRAMLAEQMKHMGGEQEICITAADLARGLTAMMEDRKDEADSDCTQDITWKGKVGSIKMRCADGATGQGTITVDTPKRMVMQMRYTMPEHGEMNNLWRARWLRSACTPER